MKNRVHTPSDALLYITDCTLATVSSMAMKRSRAKYEFDRQISIAQTAIDWMQQMGIDVSDTRAAKVIECGSVRRWAETFMPESIE